MNKLFNPHYLKKPKIYFPVIAVFIVAAGGYFYFGRSDSPKFEYIIAERGVLIREVSATGKVKPVQSVALAFEKGGLVRWVSAGVGEKVFLGQILVQLENRDIAAQIKSEQAKLDELTAGSRQEDINVQKVRVISAETSFGDAKVNLADKIQDAFTKADDAIHNKVDQFISNPKSSSPQINFAVSNDQLERDIESERIVIERVLAGWDSTDAAKVKESLNKIKSFLDNVSLAVNALTASGSLSQTTVDAYRADVLTARNNINAAISNITAADEKLRSAQSSLNLEREQLALLEAGTRSEKIAAQEASVENFQAQLAKTIIRAPIAGIVTVQNAKVGEVVSANSLMVSLISESDFEIEVNIPEADISKIKLGDEANVTLDAYGSEIVFEARLTAIDPAETVLEGVATYKTTLQFVKKDERVRSGMTSNIDILAGRADGVIVIPQRAVITKDGRKMVRLVSGSDDILEVEVEVGLRGSDGNIEIISGVSVGDKVIIFLE